MARLTMHTTSDLPLLALHKRDEVLLVLLDVGALDRSLKAPPEGLDVVAVQTRDRSAASVRCLRTISRLSSSSEMAM